MATDTTNVTNATAADLHESDIDHGQVTQSNAAPVVVQVPAGENVVRVQVTPGETIQLPFPIDAVVARLGDNGNLAVKVGDVTVILLGYAEATGQADVTLLGTDARPMDVAAVLAATDPNLDIQTAAGPAAGPGAAGADNNGGLFAPFDPSAGLDGLNAVGGLDPTALNYNLIQRNFIDLIEDEPTETDTVPIVIETTGGVVNEDDLTGNYGNVLDGGGFNDALARTEGQQSLVSDIINQFCWNPVFGNDSHDSTDYDSENTKSGTPFGSAIIGYDPNGSDNAPTDFTREPLVFNGTANVNFGPDVPGQLVFNANTLTQLEGLGLTSHGFDLQYQQIDDTHIQGYIFDGECYTLIFTVAIGDDYPNPVGAGTTFDIFFILSGALDHPLPAGGFAADETNTLIPITFQAIDSDGSTAGGQITFGVRDDIPVILENIDEGSALYHPTYAIDEDDLSPNGNGDSAPGDDWSNGTTVNGHIAVQFGADGPAAVDPLKFGVTDGQSTGVYTADGHEIFWGVTDNQHVFGHIAGSTDPVFEVSIESNGNFAFTLHDALQHPGQDNPWTEGTTETAYEDNLNFSIPVIATDFDGDSVSTTIDLNIDDDMPVINVASETGFELISDETVRATKGDLDASGENGTSEDGLRIENDEVGLVLPDALKNPDFGAVIGGATGELADIFSYAPGADGEKSHAYTLDLVNIDVATNSVHTTLMDTQSGQSIDLVRDPDGTIRGVVTIDEVEHTVFALSVDADTGEAAFAQYRAIVHEPTSDNTLYDQVVALGSGYLTAGLTVTDNDGDTVSTSKDIGDLVRFEDDGPVVGETSTLHFDDDLLAGGNSGGVGDDKPDADDLGGVQLDAEGHPYFEGALPVDFGSDGGASIKITGISIDGFNGVILAEGIGSSHVTLSYQGVAFAELEILDVAAGTYRVTQLAPFPHAFGNDENNANVSFDLAFVDGDGDVAEKTLTVNFDDDTPTATAANYDSPVAVEGGDPVFLQSLADFMADHTSAGADGYKAGSLAFQPGSLGGTLDIVANPDDGGALWIRYTPPANVNDPTPPSDEVFNFSISDTDNDVAGSTVTVKVNDGAGPTLTAATGTVDEEGLEMGLPGTSYVDGSDVSGVATSAGGTLNVVLGSDPLAADNPFNLNGTNNLNGLKTTDGTTVLLAAPTSAEIAGKTVLTLIGYEAGGSAANPADQVFILTLNRDTGQWNFQLLQPVQHPLANTEDDRNISIGVSVSDTDGTTGNGTIAITIDDDSPTMAVNTRPMPPLTVDDTTLGSDATASFAGIFTGLAGADGQKGDIAYALNVKSPGVESGVIDVATGNKVYLFLDGGVVVGREGTDALDAQTGDTVFTVSVDAAGTVKLDQIRAVQHNDPLDPQELDSSAVKLAAADLITLTAAITDRDDDQASATANIAGQLSFLDDGPSIDDNDNVQLDDDALTGGIPNGTGDVNPDTQNVTGTLAHVYGADGAGTTLLTSVNLPGVGGFTQSISPDGKTLTISQNGTPVLKVELSDTSGGSYTVTQLAPISHPAGGTENDVSFNVIYRVTDKDGDWVEGSLQIDVDDDTPTVSSNAMVQLDDDALTGGIANGTGDDANSVNATGTLAHNYGADGAGTTLLTAATLPGVGGFSQIVSPDGLTVTISQNGTPVLKIELTNATGGGYTVTQLAPISHPAGSDENNVQFTVNYQVTDKDGDTANGSMVVDVDDDTPTVSSNALVQLDDDALTGGIANGTGDDANSVNATGTLAHNYGADGAGTTLLTAATLPGVGGFSQIVSPDGLTVTISQNGTPVLKVELTNTTTGAYTVTQLAPISHPAGSDENNVQFTVNYQVTDKDGDTANGSMVVDVDDDTPTASNDSAGTVNTGGTVNVTDVSAGVLANDHFGADGAKSGGGLIGVVAGNGTTQTTSGINTSIVTALGTLVLHADGTYTYTAKTNVSGTDYFTYTIEDGDGDRTTAVLSVNVADQAQGTISGAVTVYEDGMPAQNTGDFTKQSAGLGVTFTPADNEVVTSLTIKNLPTGWKIFDGNTLLATGSGVDVPIDITLHPLANLKILPPEDNADGDISLNITATIQDPNGNLTSDINGTIAVTRDAVADKPTNVSITVTDAGANGLFSVGEGGVVNVKATFGDAADSSEAHSLVVKIPAGFSLPDWNGSTWTGFPSGGVSVASVTGSAGAGWTVTFNVADNTTSVNMNLNVTNTAAVGQNATFSVDAKAVEDQFSGTEPDNTNNTAITSASVPVVSARILNGELITNTPSAQQGDQAMILTFVQDGQPLNAYSQVVVRDTQGQQGAVLADSGFNIDPSQHFNVALENPLEGHKIIVTDFNLEGVTLDVSGGNIQIEHEDASGKPMGVYAQMSPNDGGTVIVTDSIDGTSGNNAAQNGTTGQDYLYGGAGNDTLNGNNDDDVLNGGVGNDTLNGDAGNDVLVWNGGLQTDAVTNPALGDTYHGGAGFDLLRIDQGALFNSTISGKTSIDFFPDQASDATVDLRGAHADGIEGILLTEEAVISGSGQSGSAALGTKVLLNASDVFNFSDNDTLYVIGSKGDVVDVDNATGTNTGSATWVQGAEVTPVAGGVTFVTWTGTFSDAGGSHSVTLFVDKDVTVS